jgi:serine/threonine protein kinase
MSDVPSPQDTDPLHVSPSTDPNNTVRSGHEAQPTVPPMHLDEVLKQIERLDLLEPERRRECEQLASGEGFTVMRLGRELLDRGLMTPYQLNQLMTGRGNDLILGEYVLVARLGSGGMGEVVKGKHRTNGRIVAIKLIRAERLGDPDSVRRFQREARAVLRLDHPHIVRAIETGQDGTTQYLVMEYIEGMDVSCLLARWGALPIASACEVIRQSALGLHHAHEAGLVHRDIKPSNLMLARPPENDRGAFPTVKILDLGLARMNPLSGQASSTLTEAGMVMGTPDYMAPEQIINARNADARSDLYSLGCTFYHLLTGRAPFGQDTVGLKLVRHQMSDPTPLVDLRPDIPLGVVRLVRRLMAKNPEERPTSAAEVADELARLLQSGKLGSARTFEALAGDEDAVIRAVTRWRVPGGISRRKALLVGAGAVGLLGAAVGAGIWWLARRR